MASVLPVAESRRQTTPYVPLPSVPSSFPRSPGSTMTPTTWPVIGGSTGMSLTAAMPCYRLTHLKPQSRPDDDPFRGSRILSDRSAHLADLFGSEIAVERVQN